MPNLPQPRSSLLSPQSLKPSHFTPAVTQRPLVQVNSAAGQPVTGVREKSEGFEQDQPDALPRYSATLALFTTHYTKERMGGRIHWINRCTDRSPPRRCCPRSRPWCCIWGWRRRMRRCYTWTESGNRSAPAVLHGREANVVLINAGVVWPVMQPGLPSSWPRMLGRLLGSRAQRSRPLHRVTLDRLGGDGKMGLGRGG